ncbi:hypothetical protein ACFLTA_04885 [Bacteroidota bacterium]
MKTTRKSKELPQPIRLIFLIIGIAAVCLPNWIALKAGKPISGPADINFKHVLVQEEEINPEIGLKDGVPSIDDFHLIADFEPEIPLEDWMLDIGREHNLADLTGGSHKSVPFNLKPYSMEWLSNFETFGLSDVRSKF